MISAADIPAPDVAAKRLIECAEKLAECFRSINHDLWDGQGLNVAPTRVEETNRLRQKGVDNFEEHDLDYVMFKSMTTMGDEDTFKFFLPRFLLAYAKNPYFGWTTQSHVLLNKGEMLDLTKWEAVGVEALLNAMEAFAIFEWAEQKYFFGEAYAPSESSDGVFGLLSFIEDQRIVLAPKPVVLH